MDVPSNTFSMEMDPTDHGETIFFMSITGSGISQPLLLSSQLEPIAISLSITTAFGIRMVFMI